MKLLLGEGWGECRMRVVSRWAAAVAAASMANCLMARSSKYFCSHLVMSASSARICSSFSRSCSDSRRALSSEEPPLLPPLLGLPVCLCRATCTAVMGGSCGTAAPQPRTDAHSHVLVQPRTAQTVYAAVPREGQHRSPHTTPESCGQGPYK